MFGKWGEFFLQDMMKMPVLENGKAETEEEEMEQETPGSNNSSDDDSEMGSEDEDGSGKFFLEWRGIPSLRIKNIHFYRWSVTLVFMNTFLYAITVFWLLLLVVRPKVFSISNFLDKFCTVDISWYMNPNLHDLRFQSWMKKNAKEGKQNASMTWQIWKNSFQI